MQTRFGGLGLNSESIHMEYRGLQQMAIKTVSGVQQVLNQNLVSHLEMWRRAVIYGCKCSGSVLTILHVLSH